MNRIAIVTAAAATAAALATGLAVGEPASAAPARPSVRLDSQDANYLVSNYQTDLAEITLGHYIQHVMPKGSLAHDLANHTVTDHQKAAGEIQRLARKYDVTLAATPNAKQQAAAASVKSAHHTSYQYFKVEIAGHTTSIAQTRNEMKKGRSASILAFTRVYLPIAREHGFMAQHDLPLAVH